MRVGVNGGCPRPQHAADAQGGADAHPAEHTGSPHLRGEVPRGELVALAQEQGKEDALGERLEARVRHAVHAGA